jgi:hypothetical protein
MLGEFGAPRQELPRLHSTSGAAPPRIKSPISPSKMKEPELPRFHSAYHGVLAESMQTVVRGVQDNLAAFISEIEQLLAPESHESTSALDAMRRTLTTLPKRLAGVAKEAAREFESQRITHEAQPCTVTSDGILESCALTFLPRTLAGTLEEYITVLRQRTNKQAEDCLATSARSRAALRIQSSFRGHYVRRTLKRKHKPRRPPRTEGARPNHVPVALHEAAKRIQASWRGHATRKEIKKQHKAALKIQASFRGHVARKQLKQMIANSDPTTKILPQPQQPDTGTTVTTPPAVAEVAPTVLSHRFAVLAEARQSELDDVAHQAHEAEVHAADDRVREAEERRQAEEIEAQRLKMWEEYYKQQQREAAAATKLQSLQRGRVARRSVAQKRADRLRSEQPAAVAARVAQDLAWVESERARQEAQARVARDLAGQATLDAERAHATQRTLLEHQAATKLQALQRGRIARKRMKGKRADKAA